MDVGEILNQILGLIYFLAGLGVGLWQLHTAQRQFEAQQRDKMSELQASVADIQQRLAALQLVNTERSFNVQDKLLEFAVSKAVGVREITEETASNITAVVKAELEKAGVESVVKHVSNLEAQINALVAQSTTSVIDVSQSSLEALTSSEVAALRLAAMGHTNRAIADIRGISINTVKAQMSSLMSKLNLMHRSDLVAFAIEHNLLEGLPIGAIDPTSQIARTGESE